MRTNLPFTRLSTLLCSVLFLLLVSNAYSQAFITKGTDFWLCTPYNTSGNNNIEIIISSETATSGTITSPLGLSVPFAVSPGSPFTTIVPSAYAVTASQTLENKGIRVQSLEDVTVQSVSSAAGGGDGVTVLPVTALGTEYRVTSFRTLNWATAVIVGTQNGTSLTITPTQNTLAGNAAGVPFNVTINEGQTYMVKASADLSGTLVQSSAPVNVFGHNRCSNIPSGSYCDFIWAQCIPISNWGTEYITGHLAGRTNTTDYYKVVAHTNGTQVYFNGVLMATLNAGQYYQNAFSNGNYITSNNPISVTQCARSKFHSPSSGSGDPAMIQLIPAINYGKQYRFSTGAIAYMTSQYITIVTKTANTGLARLDGAGLGGWTTIGTSGWSYTTSSLANGEHILSSDSSINGYLVGWGSVTSYGLFLGATEPLVVLPNLFGKLSGIFNPEAGNILNWHLSGDLSGKLFLERSKDQNVWTKSEDISLIPGKTDYEYLDQSISPGNRYYYRLAHHNPNGEVYHSNTIAISTRNAGVYANFYPNPSNGELSVEINLIADETVRINMVDMNGKLIRSGQWDRLAGNHQLNISDWTQNSPAGIYFMDVRIGWQTIREKIVLY